jgi:hypothetical protein
MERGSVSPVLTCTRGRSFPPPPLAPTHLTSSVYCHVVVICMQTKGIARLLLFGYKEELYSQKRAFELFDVLFSPLTK